jgi:hypothetical protein
MVKPDRGERNRRWMVGGGEWLEGGNGWGGEWLEGGMACKKKGRDRKKGKRRQGYRRSERGKRKKRGEKLNSKGRKERERSKKNFSAIQCWNF